jgi:hypothetical protein
MAQPTVMRAHRAHDGEVSACDGRDPNASKLTARTLAGDVAPGSHRGSHRGERSWDGSNQSEQSARRSPSVRTDPDDLGDGLGTYGSVSVFSGGSGWTAVRIGAGDTG